MVSVHALLRRVLRERGDERLREADAALEEIHRERAEAGEPLALAEAVYHACQQEPERGFSEWVDAFDQAQKRSRYELCETLRTVGAEFEPQEPWWRARMAQEEGDYLLVRSRYAEADEALHVSVAAYDEALVRAPDLSQAHNNKGNTLQNRGELLASLSRHEEAERAYDDTVAAYDEALYRAPDYIGAHNNKAMALSRWGKHAQFLGHDGAARARWETAQAHAERALALATQHQTARRLLSLISQRLDDLDNGSSPEE